MSAPQALLGGRYRLVRRIGAGGMGVVWEAWDEVLERPVAIKQLRTEVGVSEADAERAKNRAMREARITARLHHPHAVPVFDAVKHEGQPCLIMQYLPSTTLAAQLRERGPMSPEATARIGAQIGSALAAAHKLGIVHRDVKPGNILLTEDGNALISDFGISHALGDATLTSTGLVHGTPAYLAPEVARGGESGFPSDVFSFGSTLYAATEGAPPFGVDSNSIALLHKVAAGRFPPPVRSGPLTPLLLEMLRADPGARPSMADVAARLEALAEAARGDGRAGNRTLLLPPPAPDRPASDESSGAGEPGSEAPEAATTIDDLTLLSSALEDTPAPAHTPEPLAAAQPTEAPTEPLDARKDEAGPAEEPRPAAEDFAPAIGAAGKQGTAGSPGHADGKEKRIAAAARAPRSTAGPRTVEPLPWFVPGAPDRPAARPVVEARPSPPAPPSTPAGGRERDRRAAGIVVAALIVAVALLAGSLFVGRLTQGDPGQEAGPGTTASPRATAPSTPAPSATPDETPSPSPEQTPEPAPEQTPEPAPPAASASREEQLAQAVSSYYGLVPGNTDAAWPLMTADYQANHAGGRAAYERFWDPVVEVSVSGVRGIAPDSAEATITYVRSDGSVVDEVTAFRFVDEGGTLKIAATTVISSASR